MEKIILASGSPRRKEILARHNIEFEVCVANVDETCEEVDPEKLVMELSQRKALAVASLPEVREREEDCLILGADTVVAINGEILVKPESREDARRMISKISGSVHQVYTGVTIIELSAGTGEVTCKSKFAERTDVHVREMTPSEIDNYVASGEGDDKAGAYAIQGEFKKYILRYDGDYENVVGLPVRQVIEELCRED